MNYCFRLMVVNLRLRVFSCRPASEIVLALPLHVQCYVDFRAQLTTEPSGSFARTREQQYTPSKTKRHMF